MKKLATAQKRDIAAIAAKTDDTVDFSEMPEVADWSTAEVGRFFQPASHLTPNRPISPATPRIVNS